MLCMLHTVTNETEGGLTNCSGGLTVVIEAKLDVRDSASWDTLDKAIGRLGGTGAGNAAAAAVNGGAAVAAVAAADVLSPGESDDNEEDTGEQQYAPAWLPVLFCLQFGSQDPAIPESTLVVHIFGPKEVAGLLAGGNKLLRGRCLQVVPQKAAQCRSRRRWGSCSACATLPPNACATWRRSLQSTSPSLPPHVLHLADRCVGCDVHSADSCSSHCRLQGLEKFSSCV